MSHTHIRSSALVQRAISPVSVANNTAQNSVIIDTKGADYVEFVTSIGAIADDDATFTVSVVDGNTVNDVDNPTSITDAEAVPADFLVGTTAAASFQHDSDHQTRRLGYRARKRYVQYTITPAANSSAALFSVVALLTGFQYQPVAT